MTLITKQKIYILCSYSFCTSLFIYLIYQNRMTLSIFKASNLVIFLATLFFSFISILIRGIINQIAFNFKTTHITAFMGIKLAIINTVGNYLPMSAGLIAKGIYLKKQYNMDYMTYTAISIYSFVISIITGGLISLTILFIISKPSPVLYIASILMVSSGAILLIPIEKFNIIHRKMRFTMDIYQHIKNIFFRLLILNAIFLIVSGIRLFLSFILIENHIGVLNATLLSSIGIINRLVSFSPANIGFYETFIAALGYTINLNFQFTIVAVGIDRISDIFATFGFLLIMELILKLQNENSK